MWTGVRRSLVPDSNVTGCTPIKLWLEHAEAWLSSLVKFENVYARHTLTHLYKDDLEMQSPGKPWTHGGLIGDAAVQARHTGQGLATESR